MNKAILCQRDSGTDCTSVDIFVSIEGDVKIIRV